METDGLLTLASYTPSPPALEIRVNFGIFAGRQATPAELDELARSLVPIVGGVSVVSEQRREVGLETEAALDQVRVEVAANDLPGADAEVEQLVSRLMLEAERWAAACIDERHADVAEP